MKGDSTEPRVSHLLEIRCLNHELESRGESVRSRKSSVKTQEEQRILFHFYPKFVPAKSIAMVEPTEKRPKPHFDIVLFERLEQRLLLSYALGIITK